MDEIKRLIKKIEDKDAENAKFEVEQHNLKQDVHETEEHVHQKINTLKRHLEEKEKYGIRLQKNIETLNKQRNQLTTDVLDRVRNSLILIVYQNGDLVKQII